MKNQVKIVHWRHPVEFWYPQTSQTDMNYEQFEHKQSLISVHCLKKVVTFKQLIFLKVDNPMTIFSGVVGGKTAKTSVLPWFSKIEHSSGSALQCYGCLSLPAPAAPLLLIPSRKPSQVWFFLKQFWFFPKLEFVPNL